MLHGKNERIFLESWHFVPWHYTLHPVQSEEKIRPQQQEQQLAFTYNLWQGNIEAGSLRSCPNGFSPPSPRSRKVVTCEKCNNLGSLSLTCSRWTTETGRITEEENHYRKRGRQTSLPHLVFKLCFPMFDVFRKPSRLSLLFYFILTQSLQLKQLPPRFRIKSGITQILSETPHLPKRGGGGGTSNMAGIICPPWSKQG